MSGKSGARRGRKGGRSSRQNGGQRQSGPARGGSGGARDPLKADLTVVTEYRILGGVTGTNDIYWTSGTGWVNTARAYSFQASMMPQYASYAAVFDQFRVNWVELNFLPSQNVVSAPEDSALTSGYGSLPTLIIATDLDGTATAPSTEAQLLRWSHHRKARLEKPYTHRFTPRASNVVYDSANVSTVGYALLAPGSWIDCLNGDANHYGVVWFIDTGVTFAGNVVSENTYIRVYVKASLSFRQAL